MGVEHVEAEVCGTLDVGALDARVRAHAERLAAVVELLTHRVVPALVRAALGETSWKPARQGHNQVLTTGHAFMNQLGA